MSSSSLSMSQPLWCPLSRISFWILIQTIEIRHSSPSRTETNLSERDLMVTATLWQMVMPFISVSKSGGDGKFRQCALILTLASKFDLYFPRGSSSLPFRVWLQNANMLFSPVVILFLSFPPCPLDEVKPILSVGCFRGQTTIKHQ